MPRRPSRSRALSPRHQIEIILEEYRALYGLAQHRMASLERRVPIMGAALTGFAAGAAVMPVPFQLGLALALPVVLLWFVQTTVNHARSLEDLFRRIEEIERAVNARAGSRLLGFQSFHPSRGKAIGGRVGTGTVRSVAAGSGLLLLACLYLIASSPTIGEPARAWALAYVALCGLGAMALPFALPRYRYRGGPDDPAGQDHKFSSRELKRLTRLD